MTAPRPTFTPRELNKLQDHGIISDLVIDSADIAPQDLPRALAFLYPNTQPEMVLH